MLLAQTIVGVASVAVFALFTFALMKSFTLRWKAGRPITDENRAGWGAASIGSGLLMSILYIEVIPDAGFLVGVLVLICSPILSALLILSSRAFYLAMCWLFQTIVAVCDRLVFGCGRQVAGDNVDENVDKNGD